MSTEGPAVYDVGVETFTVRWGAERGERLRVWPEVGAEHVSVVEAGGFYTAVFRDVPPQLFEIVVMRDGRSASGSLFVVPGKRL